jgi:hypothetical protein
MHHHIKISQDEALKVLQKVLSTHKAAVCPWHEFFYGRLWEKLLHL